MSPMERRRRKSRVRSRTTRKIATTALAAGGLALFIGVGAIGYGTVFGPPKLRQIGFVYVCGGLGVLAARQALVAAAAARRRRSSQARDAAADTESQSS